MKHRQFLQTADLDLAARAVAKPAMGQLRENLVRSQPTVTATLGRGEGAGPPITAPVWASNRLPWQGQLITPSLTLSTMQPS